MLCVNKFRQSVTVSYLFCLFKESGAESDHPWPAGGSLVVHTDSGPAGSESEADSGAHPTCLTDQESQPGDTGQHRREVQLLWEPHRRWEEGGRCSSHRGPSYKHEPECHSCQRSAAHCSRWVKCSMILPAESLYCGCASLLPVKLNLTVAP